MSSFRLRDNVTRFQKHASAYLTKQLTQIAEEYEKDLTKIVEDKLLETYKENVLLSYAPRTVGGMLDKAYNDRAKEAEAEDRKLGLNARHRRKKLTYRHTGTFLNAISVETKDKRVRIVIDESATYENGKSVADVYKYLTKGTKGGKAYVYKDVHDGGKLISANNYPTPKHYFEEHTQLQMNGFLDNLRGELQHSKYNRRKYIKKRRA